MSNLIASLASFELKEWLAEAGLYVLAAVMFAGGVYLAFGLTGSTTPIVRTLEKPIRWAGFGFMFAALLLIGFTYGRSTGAAACEAAWKAKNYEAQIAQLHQEAVAKAVAAKAVEDALAEQKAKSNDDDQKLQNYREGVGRLSDALRACRAATDDDDRRLCDITGDAAACGSTPRRLHTPRRTDPDAADR